MTQQALIFLPWKNRGRIPVSWILLAFIYLLPACGSIPFSDRVAASGSSSDYKGGEYRIGPEDVLNISVWREDLLQREVLVRPDGGISFPLVGDLQAAGKTPEQVQAEITARLRKYIPEPVVNVSLAKVAGYRIYVLGQVKNPGQFVVGRYVDVLQALTLAGGLTPYASENNIKILRREQPDNEVVFPFPYAAVKKGDNLEQNIILKSGDIVVVP